MDNNESSITCKGSRIATIEFLNEHIKIECNHIQLYLNIY